MSQLALTTVAIQFVITDDAGQIEIIILSLKSLLTVLFVVSQVVLATVQFVSIVIESFKDAAQPFVVAFKLLAIGYNVFNFAMG